MFGFNKYYISNAEVFYLNSKSPEWVIVLEHISEPFFLGLGSICFHHQRVSSARRGLGVVKWESVESNVPEFLQCSPQKIQHNTPATQGKCEMIRCVWVALMMEMWWGRDTGSGTDLPCSMTAFSRQHGHKKLEFHWKIRQRDRPM